MDANETAQNEETIQEIVSNERFYRALIGFIERKKSIQVAHLSARRKGSLMDDMGKLLHSNSSVVVCDELIRDLENKRTITQKGTTNA